MIRQVEHQWHDAFARIAERVFIYPFPQLVTKSRYSPIQSVTPTMEGKVILKLGMFERIPEPEWEAFAVRRQTWEKSFDGCIQYKLVGGPGRELL
jgi:hypothetical protein